MKRKYSKEERLGFDPRSILFFPSPSPLIFLVLLRDIRNKFRPLARLMDKEEYEKLVGSLKS